jgi:hypothetical protein
MSQMLKDSYLWHPEMDAWVYKNANVWVNIQGQHTKFIENKYHVQKPLLSPNKNNAKKQK